jgi:ADP-heptose:LPS heptosyltransferase
VPWRNVLVFHIGSLGDTVLSIPALTTLRDAVGPDVSICLLHDSGAVGRVTPDALLPDGLVDELLVFPSAIGRAGSTAARLRRLPSFAALAASIRRRRFDVVVNLALSDRPAAALRRDRRFYRLCGVRETVGFEPQTPDRSEALLRLDRLRHAGIDTPALTTPFVHPAPDDLGRADAWLDANLGAADAPLVTIASGTLMPAKRWPTTGWVEVGRHLWGRGLHPVVVGGGADRPLGDQLVAAWGAGGNAAGALDPMGSAALMARASLHIGVDTGTTHLAAAVGTRVVAIYSQRAPIEQWAPVGEDHRIRSAVVPCAGCGHTVCPIADHPCLTGVSADSVIDAIDEALDLSPPFAEQSQS